MTRTFLCRFSPSYCADPVCCELPVRKGSRSRSMNNDFQNSNDARLFTLIKQAKSGDQTAFEELLTLYEPLIQSMVISFCNTAIPMQEREDFVQEATLGFYNAVMSFDLGQDKVRFGLYAKGCIRNKLISLLRTLKRHEKTVLTDDDSTLISDGNEDGDLTARVVEKENYMELSRLIRESLSPYENRIWWLYLSGRTAKEIGTLLGKDDKSVQNAIYRIRRKLRDIITYS